MTILVIGAICIVTAIVGGGLKAVGWEFPVLTSRASKVLLAGVGIAFVAIGLVQDFSVIGPNRNTPQAKGPVATTVTLPATTTSSTGTETTNEPTTSGFKTVSGPGDTNYRFTLPYQTGVDLDSRHTVSAVAAGVDIMNGLGAPNTLDVYDVSGSQKMYRLAGQRTRQNCARLTGSDGPYVVGVFLNEVHQGDQFCLRTDGKHLVDLLVEDVRRGTGDDTDIDFMVALWN